MIESQRNDRSNRCAGIAFGGLLQAVLLFVVLAQVVFIASYWRVRIDTTAEQLYTLSESTRRVIGGLEDRLLIEAYFSPDDELGQGNRVGRDVLRGLLDEFVQTGAGKVQVRYFDPASDRELRDRAIRLGIRPVQVSDQDERQFSLREFWQGLRLRYGGKKQRVIGQLAPRVVPALYESELTPMIKALSVDEKPRVGVLAYPSAPPSVPRGQPPIGFGLVFQDDEITSRYAIDRVEWTPDQQPTIPDTLDILLVIRPMLLTDAQKLALDRFVMRGGQLVIFADTDDYEIGQQRTMRQQQYDLDAPGSKVTLREMLRAYGIDIDPDRTVADLLTQAYAGNYYVLAQTQLGRQLTPVPYPHFFRSLAVDWDTESMRLQLAENDPVVAETYAGRFESGLEIDHPLIQQFRSSQGPPMFWPLVLGLHEPFPAGVGVRALMRTTPASVTLGLKQHFDPTGGAIDPTIRAQNLRKYSEGMFRTYQSLGPQQFALMVEATGRFRSAFADVRLGAAENGEPASTDDPMATPPGSDPLADAGAEAAEAADDGEDESAGPSGGGDQAARAPETARVVVFADATFLRDDLVRGDYSQLGGPVSGARARIFMRALLDWLAQDDDLVSLRSRSLVDRGVELIDNAALGGDEPWRAVELLRAAQLRLQWIYLSLPTGVLLVVGVVFWIRRSTAKRRFLAKVG